MKKHFLLALFVVAGLAAQAQISYESLPTNPNKVRAKPLRTTDRNLLIFPDIPGFITLKGDFHMHTVASDGAVKGNVRVLEAWRDGLDVIAITDHLEHPTSRPEKYAEDRSTGHRAAQGEAAARGLLLVPAAEITRKPYKWGHFNCLFIKDHNKLVKDSCQDALAEAKAQGAFIFLNHPGWRRDTCSFLPTQVPYVEDGTIQGVEVFNGGEHYPRAISWVKDKKWTAFANSDNHTIVEPAANGMFRNITLVFAKEKSLQGVREALDAHRTLAYGSGVICGHEELLKEFFLACVKFEPIGKNKKNNLYEVKNFSSIPYWIVINKNRYRIDPFQSLIYAFELKTTSAQVEVLNMRWYEDKTLSFKMPIK